MLNFARSSPAVESGFLAAEITVPVAAAFESFLIVLSWI